MVKRIYILTLAAALSLSVSMSSFAAWQQDGSKWKYEVDGIQASGEFKEIDGKVYHFSIDGTMDTGWKTIEGTWYYFATDGSMLTGEQVIDNKAYTFDGSGQMIREGIYREGLETDLLSDAFVKTHNNWKESLYALELMNQERAKIGIGPLSLDFGLSVIATYRCAHMNKYNYISHTYDNESPSDTNWLAYSGELTSIGELLQIYGDATNPNDGIKNTISPREFTMHAHNNFVRSPGHYKTMTRAYYSKVGIGFYRNLNQTRDYSTYLLHY